MVNNDKKPQQKANINRAKTRARQRLEFRSLTTELQTTSNTIYQLLFNRKEQLEGYLNRIAGLQQLTRNQTEIKDRFVNWFEGEMAEVARKTELIEKIKELELEAIGDIPNFQQIIPASYSFTWNVTHPIYWRVLEAIRVVDKHVAVIENLWLLGLMSEKAADGARAQANNVINRLFGRMRYVATASSNRKGGLYDFDEYQKIMASIEKYKQNAKEETAIDEQITDQLNQEPALEIIAANAIPPETQVVQ